MGLRWDELARRWADKCEVCGEDDQRLVSFSICIDCKHGPAGQGKTSDMGDTTKEYPIPDELKEEKDD